MAAAGEEAEPWDKAMGGTVGQAIFPARKEEVLNAE